MNKGIVMANGEVLKDDKGKLQMDRDNILKSLNRIAKMARGLYSGDLNRDPEFMEFQKSSMEAVVAQEAKNICSVAVVGIEDRLKRLSRDMCKYGTSGAATIPTSGAGKTVPPLEIKAEMKKTEKIEEDINERATLLGHINDEEMEYLKEINKRMEKIQAIKDGVKRDIKKKAVKRRTDDPADRNKKAKKKKVKKSVRKN